MSVELNAGETVSAIKYITPTSFAKPTSALYLQIPRKAHCNIVMHGIDSGEKCWCRPLGFYGEGRCHSITGDFENYVSILDADLQNLAVFALPEMKNLTVLYCSQEPMILSRQTLEYK